MTNLQSVEQDGIVAGNIFAKLDDANRGVSVKARRMHTPSSRQQIAMGDLVLDWL